jgi:hypothetical protein
VPFGFDASCRVDGAPLFTGLPDGRVLEGAVVAGFVGLFGLWSDWANASALARRIPDAVVKVFIGSFRMQVEMHVECRYRRCVGWQRSRAALGGRHQNRNTRLSPL